MRHAFTLLLALSLSACAGSEPLFGETVLRADFEGEESGWVPGIMDRNADDTPSYMLPGLPSGDGLKFIYDGPGGETGLGFIPGGIRLSSRAENPTLLIFVPAISEPDPTRFLLTWNGRLAHIGAFADPTYVAFCVTFERRPHFGNNTNMLCLRFVPDGTSDLVDVRLQQIDADGRSSWEESVGTLRQEPEGSDSGASSHSVAVILDTEARTYTVTGGNIGDIRTGTRNFLPGASIIPDRAPKLVVRTNSTPYPSGRRAWLSYDFNDISITALR